MPGARLGYTVDGGAGLGQKVGYISGVDQGLKMSGDGLELGHELGRISARTRTGPSEEKLKGQLWAETSQWEKKTRFCF